LLNRAQLKYMCILPVVDAAEMNTDDNFHCRCCKMHEKEKLSQWIY